MVILENIDIDIDKAILQNIDIDEISNRFKFGISNRATVNALAPVENISGRGLCFRESPGKCPFSKTCFVKGRGGDSADT